MSDQLPKLVKGWMQRSYLEQDGWWAALVLDEFGFMEGSGYRLTGSPLVGIDVDLGEHHIDYVGPKAIVSIQYDPEAGTIGAQLFLVTLEDFVPLDQLILERDPALTLPPRQPLDRAAIDANVRWWAAGLRAIASDVL